MLQLLTNAEAYLRKRWKSVIALLSLVAVGSGMGVIVSTLQIIAGTTSPLPGMILPISTVVLGGVLFLAGMWFVLWEIFAPDSPVVKALARNAAAKRLLQLAIGFVLIISVPIVLLGVLMTLIFLAGVE